MRATSDRGLHAVLAPEEQLSLKAALLFEAGWRRVEEKWPGRYICPREVVWLNGAPGSGKGTNMPFIMKSRGLSRSIGMSQLLDGTPEIKVRMIVVRVSPFFGWEGGCWRRGRGRIVLHAPCLFEPRPNTDVRLCDQFFPFPPNTHTHSQTPSSPLTPSPAPKNLPPPRSRTLTAASWCPTRWCWMRCWTRC